MPGLYIPIPSCPPAGETEAWGRERPRRLIHGEGGMEPGPGIPETSLPFDLWQKGRARPTREEAVCKGLVAKLGARSHSHVHGYLP